MSLSKVEMSLQLKMMIEKPVLQQKNFQFVPIYCIKFVIDQFKQGDLDLHGVLGEWAFL